MSYLDSSTTGSSSDEEPEDSVLDSVLEESKLATVVAKLSTVLEVEYFIFEAY